jgi:hypothetical protein
MSESLTPLNKRRPITDGGVTPDASVYSFDDKALKSTEPREPYHDDDEDGDTSDVQAEAFLLSQASSPRKKSRAKLLRPLALAVVVLVLLAGAGSHLWGSTAVREASAWSAAR